MNEPDFLVIEWLYIFSTEVEPKTQWSEGAARDGTGTSEARSEARSDKSELSIKNLMETQFLDLLIIANLLK